MSHIVYHAVIIGSFDVSGNHDSDTKSYAKAYTLECVTV